MFSIKDLPIKNNQSFLNYQQYHICIYIFPYYEWEKLCWVLTLAVPFTCLLVWACASWQIVSQRQPFKIYMHVLIFVWGLVRKRTSIHHEQQGNKSNGSLGAGKENQKSCYCSFTLSATCRLAAVSSRYTQDSQTHTRALFMYVRVLVCVCVWNFGAV